jgi:hypothetical protein
LVFSLKFRGITVGNFFFWRFPRDWFPTRAKLVTKKVLCPQNCIRSNSYGKKSWHFFVNCHVAIDTWKSLKISDLIEPHMLHTDKIADLFFKVAQKMS